MATRHDLSPESPPTRSGDRGPSRQLERTILLVLLVVPLVLAAVLGSDLFPAENQQPPAPSSPAATSTVASKPTPAQKAVVAASPTRALAFSPLDLTPPPTLSAPTGAPRSTAAAESVMTPAAQVTPATPVARLPSEPLGKPTPSPEARTYMVQPGDQLKHVAARFGVSIWDIAAANDIPDPDNLQVGQQLVIPLGP